jgi:hypothetical protein
MYLAMSMSSSHPPKSTLGQRLFGTQEPASGAHDEDASDQQGAEFLALCERLDRASLKRAICSGPHVLDSGSLRESASKRPTELGAAVVNRIHSCWGGLWLVHQRREKAASFRPTRPWTRGRRATLSHRSSRPTRPASSKRSRRASGFATEASSLRARAGFWARA